MLRKFDRLNLNCLDDALHGPTCGYWYTVTSGSTPQTAFRTKAALMAWLDRRNIDLTKAIPDKTGTYQSQPLRGEYFEQSHMHSGEVCLMRRIGRPFVKLSNGRYTMAFATEKGGIRTIHYLNPNAERIELDYTTARSWEDEGLEGFPSARIEKALEELIEGAE